VGLCDCFVTTLLYLLVLTSEKLSLRLSHSRVVLEKEKEVRATEAAIEQYEHIRKEAAAHAEGVCVGWLLLRPIALSWSQLLDPF
jgi:hypothetical protein